MITSPPPLSLPLPATSAPRVRVRQTEGGHAVEPVLDETLDLDEFRVRSVGAFGTTEQLIAEALFQQVVNALHPDPKKLLDARTANLVLALLSSHRPAGRAGSHARIPDEINHRGTAAHRIHRIEFIGLRRRFRGAGSAAFKTDYGLPRRRIDHLAGFISMPTAVKWAIRGAA